MAHPHWQGVVHNELYALLNNSTWSLCPLPAARRSIDCKWLFKVKKKVDGPVDRYKAWLVAKWFSQHAESDFVDTFSLVVWANTIRTILIVVVMNGRSLRQIDVNNALRNGALPEEIYMDQPSGFEVQGTNGEQLVCKLNKILYGLRQAHWAWFHTLRKYLVEQLDFQLSKVDPQNKYDWSNSYS